MTILVVVHHPRDWPFDVPGTRVVTARDYLTDPAYGEMQSGRVLNLCRTDRYQGRGYYVSLLAEARGQRPLPEVKTLGDLQSGEALDRLLPAGVAEQLQRALAGRGETTFALDAFLGRDPRREYVRRAGRPRATPSANGKASVAILRSPDEPHPPSNPAAIEKLCAASRMLGMDARVIGRDDADRLPEFDALFIRDTTNVNHYTYQFARRAAAEGLVVVDDPESILKCTNKVYLNELLSRHKVPMPKTLMVHRDNVDQVVPLLGLPCILKQPDSAFSLGVAKAETSDAVRDVCARLLERSDLLIAQEWLPTPFDWRVGVYDRRPLYVCKYFMAPGHWQVVKREPGRTLEGSTQALTVGEAPEIVVRAAVRAANLIGDGLYGVDLKQDGRQCYVMEVNDNPNLDADNEDGVLKDALYREVMGVFLRRIRERRRSATC